MKTPKPKQAWGIYNFGRLISTECTRRDAICEVERFVGEPWAKAKQYIQVMKVTVTPTG